MKRTAYKNLHVIACLLAVLICCSGCALIGVQKPRYDYSGMDRKTKTIHKKAESFARKCIRKEDPVQMSRWLRVDSVSVNKQDRQIHIYYNRILGHIPYRSENIKKVYKTMRKQLGWRYRNYDLTIYSKNFPVEELVPNYFRTQKSDWDTSRLPVNYERPLPIVRNISKPRTPTKGLNQRNIALWHSHGWYYENKLQRWEWQRARVFQTVEDLFPMSFTVPYLVPMLENAGANVFIPRERDLQTHEVIVDYDSSSTSDSYFEISSDTSITFQSAPDSSGFAIGNPPYEAGVNPFRQGSYRYIASDTAATAEIQFIPEIPEDGYYAVTIAYKSLDNSIEDAHYTVYHLGGKTEFLVNQQIGGGTWIFLGKFQFRAGRNPDIGKIVLTNRSRQAELIVTADAVRFGGGMGNISREGQISGRPRYAEGARYYLQYAGMPDTLVYNLNGDSIDYVDDYQCRGEWVNYLKGAPFGPNKKRDEKGLRIPVDLSLAFHTDAGRTRTGIVIGTLSIYNTDGADSTLKFPNGQSRLANRDLADILQTQIVDDIQAKYDPLWNRRALWDSGYSEAWRPNVPSVLLELLSHHNYLDMKFGNDPRFRFDASRAIYKAFLRFMATQYQTDYVVQPLPVNHFQVELVDGNNVALRWKPTIDPLEITAMADKYILYTRLDDKDFNNGKLVSRNNVILKNIRPGAIYSFKVTAVNDGGESFPSEILSVCYLDGSENSVCIVSGFDRVAPPATLETDEYLGFANFWDQGVADGYELAFTGDQYDLLADSPWLDDDSPGHGASHADCECTIVAGNTHDFVYAHGKSIRFAGYSFISASDEAIMDGAVDLARYDIVDIIMGEEKLTEGPKPFLEKQFEVFPVSLQESLKTYCQSGGSIFISGAYIGTDPFVNVQDDSVSINFVQNNLKYKWRTDHAVKTGGIYSVDSLFMPFGNSFEFNTLLNPGLYAAESPDAIEPADTTAVTILRYRENNTSAAVGFKGDYSVVAFGFPFETIPDQGKRDEVMQAILNYLKK